MRREQIKSFAKRKNIRPSGRKASLRAFGFLVLFLASCSSVKPKKTRRVPRKVGDRVGEVLVYRKDHSQNGYLLYSTIRGKQAYLINKQGRILKIWKNTKGYPPGGNITLLKDGRVLYLSRPKETKWKFGGEGGRAEIYSPEGKLEWEYEYFDSRGTLHHEALMMPGGKSILFLALERKDKKEVEAAGRIPFSLNKKEKYGDLLIDKIMEVDIATKKVIWQWNAWDHMIQNFDPAKAGYGSVSKNPGRLNINYHDPFLEWTRPNDLFHINNIAYLPEQDVIMISSRDFSEVWFIDHGTTTAEAAGSKGGNYGKGGDLLFRFGNPSASKRKGTRTLYFQHGAVMIPGEGLRMILFDNGSLKYNRGFSSVREYDLKTLFPGKNRLGRPAGTAEEPPLLWNYRLPGTYAHLLSNAERLPGGNTLILHGIGGTFYEVTPGKKIVWKLQLDSLGKIKNALKIRSNSVFMVHEYPVDSPAIRALRLNEKP